MRPGLARFLLVTAQVRALKWRAPIRAGIAGSSPDLAPGPAPAREMRQKVPALQNFQLLLPVAA